LLRKLYSAIYISSENYFLICMDADSVMDVVLLFLIFAVS